MTRTRTIHMCLDIRGFIRNNHFPRDYRGVFQHDDGKPMEPQEAQDFLFDCIAKGWKVIPCDSSCDGFDYQKGCPGHEIPDEVKA